MSNDIKVERLQSTILRELNLMVRNFLNSEIIPSLTVHEVRLTSDLSKAKVFYSFVGDYLKEEVTAEIANYLKEIRHNLAEKVSMRAVPELEFVFDDSLETANRIDEILNDINKEN
ncbi:30S ribosome-binding factor RbfA [Spiroplasma endosymbiont of Labia minor]|uniref:30S ribosome-binding factor RbfA n=1 Tax=Spiroplasma endosymbiont of Labia minor TaxID=3066305 RepID=UPI0030D5C8E4